MEAKGICLCKQENACGGLFQNHRHTIIKVIMGRRLLDEVVYRIRIRIKAGKAVPAITEAVKVGKKTIYKIRLNLNI